MPREPVELACEHVIRGRAIVERQRTLIRRLRAARYDCRQAEDLLVQFESSLHMFEEDTWSASME